MAGAAFDLPPDLLANIFVQGKVSLGGLCMLSVVSQRWYQSASLAMQHSTFRSLSLCVDADEPSSPLRRLVGLEELDLSGSGAMVMETQLASVACTSSLTMLRWIDCIVMILTHPSCLVQPVQSQTCSQRADLHNSEADHHNHHTQTIMRSVAGARGSEGISGVLACGRLRTLGMSSCSIGNSHVSRLASNLCRSLENVDLSQTEVGDDGVMMMALMLNLRELSLRECRITDVALYSLAQSSRGLEVLDLSKCKGSVTNRGVASMCGGCGHLRTLVLSWCGEVTLDCLEHFSRLSQLETLIAAGLPCSSPPAFEFFSALTQLDISVTRPFWQVGDRVLNSLTACPSSTTLTTLRLVGCSISDIGVEALSAHMPEITSLDLTGTRVSDRGVTAIAKGCRNLLVLRLNSCGSVGDTGFGFVALHLTSLRELDIKSTLVTDSGIKKLHPDRLHVLSVAHCDSITSVGLHHAVQSCGGVLRVLNVAGLVISRSLIRAFAALPLLRWLNVTDCFMQDDSSEGRESDSGKRSAHMLSYEYAAVILQLPALRMDRKHGLKRISSRHAMGTDSGQQDFPCLETLHTDRCTGLSCLLRLIAAVGAPVLRRITLSGPEILGADVLVLAQSCRRLQEVCLRRCDLDASVVSSLRQRGVSVDS